MWTALDRRWWRLDLETALLRRQLQSSHDPNSLRVRLWELLREQEAIVRRMDEILAGLRQNSDRCRDEGQSRFEHGPLGTHGDIAARLLR